MTNTKTTMEKRLYTTHQIEEFADGDKQFLRDTISIFVKEAPDNLVKLEEALQAKSWEKLREVAHRFAPHLAFFEITPAYESLRRVEVLAQEQQGIEEIEMNLLLVKEQASAAIEQMNSDFGF